MFGIDDAALATMLAGGISTAAGLYTNKKNRDYQAEANRINWEIAKQNNATQIEMANTAHEREVRDLRRAGLNPILSAGGNGSSTPSLQGADIQSIKSDNAFEGLANSAKGLGRYLSQEYKNQVEGQVLTNVGQELGNQGQDLANQAQGIANKAALEDLETHRIEAKAARVQAQNDLTYAELEQDAWEHLHGHKHVTTDKFGGSYNEFDWKAYDRLKALQVEALESSIKVRANENWRANLSSFTPFVSPAAINSAGSAFRKMRGLFK